MHSRQGAGRDGLVRRAAEYRVHILVHEMDAMPLSPDIALAAFLIGAFAAALVTGLAGFAFGIVAAAIWLHALAPAQVTALVAAYALLVQGYAVWKLRHALNLGRLWPFLLGSAAGIPAGVAILKWVPAAYLRTGVGVLLVLFSLHNLVWPRLPQLKRGGRAADVTVGILNGALGASTGLAGILVVIWSGMRGWSRDEQRATFQPVGVATFLMIMLALGGSGIVTPDTVQLFLLGLPALLAGTWLGWALYGKLNEGSFRRVVLLLLLLSGLALVVVGPWR